MTIVVDVDDSFKRPGTIPFSWEIRPGVPKTRISKPDPVYTTTTLLQPPKKLSPLRLKPLSSHSQQLLPPALSPPSSSFFSTPKKTLPLSPLTPSFTTPSKLKPPPPPSSSLSQSGGFYSPAPSFRSSPRAFSERWQLHRPNRVRSGSGSEPRSDFSVAGFGCFPTPKFRSKKNKNRRKGSKLDRDYFSDVEAMSPWTVSSRRSFSPRWDSPKSSFSSLRFSPRLVNEAEWVGLGLF